MKCSVEILPLSEIRDIDMQQLCLSVQIQLFHSHHYSFLLFVNTYPQNCSRVFWKVKEFVCLIFYGVLFCIVR